MDYTYYTGTWRDVLTSYDGDNISHDGIGNLKSDRLWTYTWEHGRELASMAVSSEFAIITQPEDGKCLSTGRAYFNVVAAGTDLTYQWQWLNGSTWVNSKATGAQTSSMSVGAAGENGTTYRCVVTDGAGNVLISDSAKVVHVPILITSQPTDWWGTADERAPFTVQVISTDTNLTYQWQWLNGSTWTNSKATGVTTNSMSVGAAGENGTTYRCYITDSAGNVAISDSATVHTDPLGFITQPEDCICSPSGKAYFSVEVYGTGVTYQWQWHSPSSSTWKDSAATGAQTNAISLGVSGDNGTVYRCVITDAAGNVAYSEPATVIPYAITWDYTYDANGLRTHRTNGVTTYDYIYNGGSLTQMTVTDELDGSKSVVTFAYDAAGKSMSLDHNGTRYIYVTNIQGDVIALSDTSGNKVVEYTYDAWGNIQSITGSMAATLGQLNPLRYRGYVYDQETGLYYLQSRYYNPEWGRFINADALVSTGQGILSNNMFTYCLNNPVNLLDSTGTVAMAAVVAPAAYEAFMAFLTSVAASNAWNAIGWAAAAILATGIITIGAMYLYEWFLNEQAEEISVEIQEDIEGYASPPGNDDDDDDWDDDYYNDDSNFGGRERMGKQKGQAPRNNQKQNEQFNSATKGLSKAKQQKIHREISDQGLGYKGIREIAKDFRIFIFTLFDEEE